MMRMSQRFASSLGVTLALGLVLAPEGCGGGAPILEVPATIQGQIRACAAEHRHHLGEGAHSIGFDVKFADDGHVDFVDLRESTLGDQVLEQCLVSALRSFSEDEFLALRPEDRPRTPVAPESRALLGMAPATVPAVAACIASLPCVLSVGFLMGATYITVTFFVQRTSKHGPPKPPDCPRNERFVPERNHNSTGCYDKKGNLQCYSTRHPPCAGMHTHGILHYQEIRRGECIAAHFKAVRCEGPFKISGPCGSVSTVGCGKEGWETSGIFKE
jgi:hypothetical protein